MHAGLRRIALAIAALAASVSLGVSLGIVPTDQPIPSLADNSWCC